MEIKLNGKTLDVSLDEEKNIAQVMAALEQWLSGSGHRLSAIAIDGKNIDTNSMEAAFSKEIDNVNVLDIFTSSITDLGVMCLINLLSDIDEYESLDYENKKAFYQNWQKTPASIFAQEQMPDIFSIFKLFFTGQEFDSNNLRILTEERLREFETPADEFKNIGHLVDEVVVRLIDLPLDMQTGKDSKAAGTMAVFSSLCEKIIRLFLQMNLQGLIKEENQVNDLINDFNNTVNDLLQAYETHDTVLIGDLSEYEMAPKLKELYDSIAGAK